MFGSLPLLSTEKSIYEKKKEKKHTLYEAQRLVEFLSLSLSALFPSLCEVTGCECAGTSSVNLLFLCHDFKGREQESTVLEKSCGRDLCKRHSEVE